MTDEDYMRLAIKEAKKSEKAGGDPIAAIIVKDEKVVASGWSFCDPEMNPTSHAEINCIKHACSKLKTLDLEDCTMYCTLEPCSLCLGGIAWGHVSRVIFGSYNKDIMPENPNELYRYSAIKRAHAIHALPEGGHANIRGGVLRKECAHLLSDYKNWHKVKHIVRRFLSQ